jgi:hypothetical protein
MVERVGGDRAGRTTTHAPRRLARCPYLFATCRLCPPSNGPGGRMASGLQVSFATQELPKRGLHHRSKRWSGLLSANVTFQSCFEIVADRYAHTFHLCTSWCCL